MQAIKTKRKEIRVGNLTVLLESIYENFQYGDTRVDIEGENLCYISGQEISDFEREFKALIDKYRI